MLLQHALGVPTPAYLHTPLVLMPDGEKLSSSMAPHHWISATHCLRYIKPPLYWACRPWKPRDNPGRLAHMGPELAGLYNAARDRYSSYPRCP
jgi:glutamyl-Q tRNA(Asp) synthetase